MLRQSFRSTSHIHVHFPSSEYQPQASDSSFTLTVNHHHLYHCHSFFMNESHPSCFFGRITRAHSSSTPTKSIFYHQLHYYKGNSIAVSNHLIIPISIDDGLFYSKSYDTLKLDLPSMPHLSMTASSLNLIDSSSSRTMESSSSDVKE